MLQNNIISLDDSRDDYFPLHAVNSLLPTSVIAFFELEGTRRVRTHAVLLLTLTLTVTFDLSTQNMSLVGYPKF